MRHVQKCDPACSAEIRTRRKLIKTEVTKRVPTYKWVVEYVCDSCGPVDGQPAGCADLQRGAGGVAIGDIANAGNPNATEPVMTEQLLSDRRLMFPSPSVSQPSTTAVRTASAEMQVEAESSVLAKRPLFSFDR